MNRNFMEGLSVTNKINFCVKVTTREQVDAVFAIVEAGGGKTGGNKDRDFTHVKTVYSSDVTGYAWMSCFSKWQSSSREGKQFDTIEEFAVWYLGYDVHSERRAELNQERDLLLAELDKVDTKLAALK